MATKEEWIYHIKQDDLLQGYAIEYAKETDKELFKCYSNTKKHLSIQLITSMANSIDLDAVAVEYADDFQELGNEIISNYAEHRAKQDLNDEAEAKADKMKSIEAARCADY